jgi:hypothetical protein
MAEPESSEHREPVQRYTEEPSEKAWVNAIARDVEGYDSTEHIIVRDCGSRRWYDINGWVYREDALEEQRKLDALLPENNPTIYEFMCFHGIRYKQTFPKGEEPVEVRTVVDGHVCVFNRIGTLLA